MRLALVSAVRDLQRLFGRDMRTWQWGRLHRASLTHPLEGRGLPDRFAILGPFTAGGNANSVTHSSFNSEHPYEATGGSVARFVMDLAVPDAASVVISTGESGEPLSPHYHDQSAMWLNGIFHRLEINPNRARDERWKRLTLRPRR
jgi:penicillin amidase